MNSSPAYCSAAAPNALSPDTSSTLKAAKRRFVSKATADSVATQPSEQSHFGCCLVPRMKRTTLLFVTSHDTRSRGVNPGGYADVGAVGAKSPLCRVSTASTSSRKSCTFPPASGCSTLAFLRKAVLICAAVAPLSRPKILYGFMPKAAQSTAANIFSCSKGRGARSCA